MIEVNIEQWCMINDAAMTILGGVRASSVTLGSYQVCGGRKHELIMKWKG